MINLAAVWGLGQERGKEAIEKLPRNTVVNASMKRTSYRGVVEVIYGGDKLVVATPPDKAQFNEGKKRKQNGHVEMLPTIADKPLSKTQMRKRRKAALEEQAQKAATGENGMQTKPDLMS